MSECMSSDRRLWSAGEDAAGANSNVTSRGVAADLEPVASEDRDDVLGRLGLKQPRFYPKAAPDRVEWWGWNCS